MKRFFHLGLVGLAATATLMPFRSPLHAANAQDVSMLEELELTDEQQEQVQDIFQDLRGDIDDILTDEQQAQFREAYQEAQDFRTAAAAIDNLTNDQKAQIRAAMQASRGEISEVLTEDQRAELRAALRERRLNRR
jgi:Spy/CpxP family protein refolding chaperone